MHAARDHRSRGSWGRSLTVQVCCPFQVPTSSLYLCFPQQLSLLPVKVVVVVLGGGAGEGRLTKIKHKLFTNGGIPPRNALSREAFGRMRSGNR